MSKLFASLAALGVSAAMTSMAFAQPGQPVDWQLGLQPPVSPVAKEGQAFFELLMWLMTLITLVVTALLGWVLYRYSAKRNPTPSKTTHNTLLEVAWTVIPVIILVVIAVPSFRLLYYSDRVEDADLTLKVIGKQWYWSYE